MILLYRSRLADSTMTERLKIHLEKYSFERE